MREWLKEARARKGLTIFDMGELLGCTYSYYSYIENGNRQKKLELQTAVKLSEILGISLQEIIDAEEALSA